MAVYKCFYCGKEINSNELRKKIRCPYCGKKVLYKPRTKITYVKAR